jgi:hypothetical protein
MDPKDVHIVYFAMFTAPPTPPPPILMNRTGLSFYDWTQWTGFLSALEKQYIYLINNIIKVSFSTYCTDLLSYYILKVLPSKWIWSKLG